VTLQFHFDGLEETINAINYKCTLLSTYRYAVAIFGSTFPSLRPCFTLPRRSQSCLSASAQLGCGRVVGTMSVRCQTKEISCTQYTGGVTFPILPPCPSGDGSLRKLTKLPNGCSTAAAVRLKRVTSAYGKVEQFLDAREETMKAHSVWEKPYEATVVETDGKQLPSRLRIAKAAIDDRLHELQLAHGGTPEERRAISDALADLNVLRRELEARSHDAVLCRICNREVRLEEALTDHDGKAGHEDCLVEELLKGVRHGD
jgi:hypothetical protein